MTKKLRDAVKFLNETNIALCEDHEDGKLYEGICAFSDIDGYTVYLKGSGVLLRFGFHNTYHLDYQHEKNKEDFLKKVLYIAEQEL